MYLIDLCKYVLVFTLAPTVVCCTDHKTSEDLFKGKDKRVHSTTLVADSVYMRYPFRIKKFGSDLIISDLHGAEFYCYRFSYPHLQLKQSFAGRGDGPCEFLDVENIRFSRSGNLVALDANKSMITTFDMSEMKSVRQVKLDKRLLRTLDFDLINDSMLIVPDYTGENRFCIINNRGLILERLFDIPVRLKANSSSNTVVSQAWRSFLDYNPENGILAMVTQLGHVVEIFNMNKKSIVNIVYGSNGEPEFIDNGAYAVPNGIMGYEAIQKSVSKLEKHEQNYNFEHGKEKESKTSASRGLNT